MLSYCRQVNECIKRQSHMINLYIPLCQEVEAECLSIINKSKLVNVKQSEVDSSDFQCSRSKSIQRK